MQKFLFFFQDRCFSHILDKLEIKLTENKANFRAWNWTNRLKIEDIRGLDKHTANTNSDSSPKIYHIPWRTGLGFIVCENEFEIRDLIRAEMLT